MLIAGFPAGSFGTNCYVVAPGPGERCVVVDPGQDAVGPLTELLREHRLRPAAVILTHGHLDHMWSVTPVCGAHDVPAYIHPADRFMLADPLKGVSAQFAAMVGGVTFTEPEQVRELADGKALGLTSVLGFDLVVDHAPGHTKGSVTFTLPRLDDAGDPDVMFSGDLLFAGSIGRSDLPGGDPAEMNVSLARVVLPRPDDTLVLPGHGGRTTIGRERASNPFLRGLRSVDSARPGL
ncbi:MBL fold metallo-hydrolase [Actinospica durhamensis]|uniref:MBL fold metallo-hydrolase n=1 Tax=Actinospica durhamensis TaxID=1508375 RepID=A0A941EJS1_9ACTN|nr:MBL fold metallo-hydrolase [Actinospica durhamensis]MBR7832666.1 MBL fold metallo-hydrolase [Actinospica durhamensis]